jgi:hypothetical protein
MESILTSSTPDRYQARRHLKLTDKTPIPLKYHKVLALHLSGMKVTGAEGEKTICSETGYKPPSIYKILKDDRVVEIRQQLMSVTQSEFEALYGKVVDTLRGDLFSGTPEREHKAREQWLRASGKYKSESDKQVINVTAEDVVFQILNAPKEGPYESIE